MNATVTALVGHLTSLGDLTLLFLTLGVILSWRRRTRTIGMAISTVAVLIFLTVEYSPLARWLIAPLENRFAKLRVLPSHVDGLIVLGGAVDPSTALARNVPTLNSEAERMTEFLRLARIYPGARLVFAGGAGSRGSPPTLSEADVAQMFFRQQGLDPKRVLFEAHSQNTYENALFAKSMVRPKPSETWILVASAQDVPRCMAVFRKLKWPMIPSPIAYKSDAENEQRFSTNLRLIDRSVHEWIGLLFYRLTGKTDELFPGPAEAEPVSERR